MNNRYFSHSDGSLFRFDKPGTFCLDGKVIRENFRVRHSEINSGQDLRATLRAGPAAWPGGYSLYFITSDGATLSFHAVLDNLHSVLWSIRNDVNDGWRVVATGISYGSGEPDDPDNVYCDHTGELI